MVLLFQYLDKDQNIVQVHYHDIFYYEVLKNVIHHSLESSSAVCHNKEYYQEFKKTAVYIEDSLPLITRLDANIVEASAHVQLSKVLGILNFCHRFGN